MTVQIITGDCREVLGRLPAKHFHTCVTSPPYFGLRDYNVDGQMGLEPSPDEFVLALVDVFRDVRRVLRDDGTVWLNLGDSYAGSWGAQSKRVTPGEISRNSVTNHPKRASRTGVVVDAQMKPKDLMGIPWMVAFALRADGWYLRQDLLWHKPNPMPESVTDRCTKAHEYVFLLSKSPKYYYDQEAVLEESSPSTHARLSQNVRDQIGSDRAHAGGKTNGRMKAVARNGGGNRSLVGTIAYEAGATEHRTKAGLVAFSERQRKMAEPGSGVKNNTSMDAALALVVPQRNKRSVWTVGSEAFSEAHFATFPPALIEPCILAGCPAGGQVLDPFGGAGTTGLVADRHGRNATLVELNPEYAQMARRRIQRDAGMFADVTEGSGFCESVAGEINGERK